ncbi:MAG: relaxase domain-containing protein [Ilumatobacteraceae bacterium]
MLRVTTLHASSATATARYYAQYLTAAPGEEPGVWSGRQAAGLALSGTVDVEALELSLAGRDPVSGKPLVGSCSTGTRRTGGWCGRCQGSTPRSRHRSRCRCGGR